MDRNLKLFCAFFLCGIAGFFLPVNVFAGWTLVYQTDFSSDPGWTTNNSSNYYRDAAENAYKMVLQDASGEYGTKSVAWSGESFRLEFDVKPVSIGWAGDVLFGLMTTGRHVYNESHIWLNFGYGDLGYGLSLHVRNDSGQVFSSDYYPCPTQLGIWYHNEIEYSSTTKNVSYRTTKVSDGAFFSSGTITNVGVISGLSELGGSKIDDNYAPGATGTGYLDNVKFYIYTSTWELQLPFDPGSQDTVLLTVTGRHGDEGAAQAAEVFGSSICYVIKNDGSSNPSKTYCYNPVSGVNALVLSETTDRFTALKVMNGKLYITHTNGKLWEYDGNTVTEIAGTPFNSSYYASAMREFNGKMYFGTRGGRIYESANLSSFSLRATYSGDTNYDGITSFVVWNNYLYGCNGESYDYSSKIFRSADGTNWSVMGTFSTYTFEGLIPTPNYLYAASVEDASGPSFSIRKSSDGANWSQIFYTGSQGKITYGSPVYFSQNGRAYFITTDSSVTRAFPSYEGNIETAIPLTHAFASLVELEGRLFGIGAQNPSHWENSPTVISLLGNYTQSAATNGSISGSVTTSEVIRGAQGDSTIKNYTIEILQSGSVVDTFSSSSGGNYTFANIPAGVYDVRASALGYETQTKTGVAVTAGTAVTENFELRGGSQSGRRITLGNNLFSPRTGGTAKIKFNVAAAGSVSLKIYDLSGKLVRTLFEGVAGGGDMQKDWDGRDDSGRYVVPGVYFLHYVNGGNKEVRKIGVKK